MAKMKMGKMKKVMAHLKDDMKTFKHEAADDRKLMRALKGKSRHEMKESKAYEKKEEKKKPKPVKIAKVKKAIDSKMKKVFHEFGEGMLHSGSKKGPKVTNVRQATAIAYSEARRKAKKMRSKK